MDRSEIPKCMAKVMQKLPETKFRPAALFSKTHFTYDVRHPFLDQTSKVIHLVRHPKDVLLSALNYRRLVKTPNLPSDQELAQQFIDLGGDQSFLNLGYGTWFEHYKPWSSCSRYPIYTLRYDDLRQDTHGEFSKLLKFLELPYDSERANKAVEQTRLSSLRKLEVNARENDRFFDAEKNRFFTHKGVSGQTLQHLGADLDQKFDERFAHWLQASGYTAKPQTQAA